MKRSVPGCSRASRRVWRTSANARRQSTFVPLGAGFRSRKNRKIGREKSRKSRAVRAKVATRAPVDLVRVRVRAAPASGLRWEDMQPTHQAFRDAQQPLGNTTDMWQTAVVERCDE